MRKTVLYLTVAVVIGILTTLTPLFILAALHQDQYGSTQFYGGFRSLDEASSQFGQSGSFFSDLGVLVISFVIAMLLFLFVRHRIPRDLSRTGMPPY